MTLRPEIWRAVGWAQRGDTSRALHELEALVARAPDAAELHNAFGSVLASTGQTERAVAAFQRAVSLSPGYLEASTNLGSALLDCGQIAAALAAFEAIGAERTPAQASAGMAHAAALLGRFRDARAALDRGTNEAGAPPALHSQRCYTSLLDPESDAARVAAVHRDFEVRIAAPLLSPVPVQTDRGSRRKLRLGYVSADFREHSVACFLEPVLAAHDRSAIEVVAYSDVRKPDSTTERLRALVDRWVDIRPFGNDELVRLIRQQRIDVLIDLAGHMQPNRLPAFAQRPAPLLFTYLGYPGTTGMSVFDGRITDATADSIDDPSLAGPERQLHVPGGCFAYAAPADAPELAETPCSTSGHITFGSMNDVVKLNDPLLVTWAQILKRVPRSRLFLKARALSSKDVRARIQHTLGNAGIAPQRLELAPATPSRREHLSVYSRLDIALDTFPYSGATTTCEALYMGVPVVTLAGDRHAGRLSTTVLHAMALDEFVARTPEEYIDTVVQLAEEPERLSRLRQMLRTRVQTSTLADGARVARTLERAAFALQKVALG